MSENYNGFEITLITDGRGNNESWYYVRQGGVILIHSFIRGRISSCEPIHRVVDNMKGAYPKLLMQA